MRAVLPLAHRFSTDSGSLSWFCCEMSSVNAVFSTHHGLVRLEMHLTKDMSCLDHRVWSSFHEKHFLTGNLDSWLKLGSWKKPYFGPGETCRFPLRRQHVHVSSLLWYPWSVSDGPCRITFLRCCRPTPSFWLSLVCWGVQGVCQITAQPLQYKSFKLH